MRSLTVGGANEINLQNVIPHLMHGNQFPGAVGRAVYFRAASGKSISDFRFPCALCFIVAKGG